MNMGEVCRHLRDAQMVFLQSKPLITLATGYTESESNAERELDLSGFAYEPDESQNDRIEDETGARSAPIAYSVSLCLLIIYITADGCSAE